MNRFKAILRFFTKEHLGKYGSAWKDRGELLEKLKRSEARYHALFRYSPISTVVVDQDGRITEYNLARERARTRLPKVGDLMYRDYAGRHRIDMYEELMGVIRSGTEKEFPELRYEDRFLHVHISPFPGGAIITSWDITETRNARDDLLVSEARYRLLAENVTDVIWTSDMDMNFTYVSPSVFRSLGFTAEETLTRKVDEALTPGSFALTRQVLAAQTETEKTTGVDPLWTRTLELEFWRKDGSTAWSEVQLTFLRGVTNDPVGILGVGRDITERKRDLAEKKKLEAKLQQAQKMEAIANLAGGIAHQFNNALAVMAAHLDLMNLESPENSFMFSHTEPMKDAVWRMTHLTSQLLAYARGGKYQAKKLSLYDFVRETLPLVKHAVKPEIRVKAELPQETWPIRADVTQMQMVLSAVLANASDAIEGAGVIRITAKNVQMMEKDLVDYPGLTPGSYVILTIQDNGKGMDEETRQRIFEPFFTTKFQGRGLGMAAVYGIVKNHDGWTQVDSQPEKGTSVHLLLPAVSEWPERRKGQETAFAAGTGTILIVEDEKLVLDATRRMLERLGYRVLEAKSGTDALDVAGRHEGEIDLVILDIQLPDMHGKEIYPRLSQLRPGIKVIVCSGYSIDGPAQEILDAGADAFLQKPFSLSALSKMMREILGRSAENHPDSQVVATRS